MAHLKKSSTTGHLVKNAAGHLVNGCNCTCDPDAIPSAITIDLTNLDLSGCDQTCSPDDSSPWAADQSEGECEYQTTGTPPLCWDGFSIETIYVWFDADLCQWKGEVEGTGSGGGEFAGPSGFSNGPAGTYTRTSGCATGSFEVEE